LTVYLDSSLLVSLHTLDGHSKWASRAMAMLVEPPLLTELCRLEVVNAIHLKTFRREISAFEAIEAIQSFEGDLSAGLILLNPLPERAFSRALLLSQRTTPTMGIRTADILHVAAALELGADSFFSFDVQQRKLAAAVGLGLNPI